EAISRPRLRAARTVLFDRRRCVCRDRKLEGLPGAARLRPLRGALAARTPGAVVAGADAAPRTVDDQPCGRTRDVRYAVDHFDRCVDRRRIVYGNPRTARPGPADHRPGGPGCAATH